MFICIGLDVHAKKITAFGVPLDSYDEEGLEFCRSFNRDFRTINADRHDLERLAKYISDVEHSILIENSTKTHEVFWNLTDAGCTVIVANAADLFRITKSVKKTDHHDCEELSHYMRRRVMGEDEFAQCLMVDSLWMNRRQLCRLCAQTSDNLSDTRRKIRSYMLIRGISVTKMESDIVSEANLIELEGKADSSLRSLIELARFQRFRLDDLRKAVRKEFRDDPMFNLILSIPGFGDTTSSYITAMIVKVDRFDSPSAFAAYFGIVPKQRESADHNARCGITRRGDDVARNMLVLGTFKHISIDRDRQSNISVMYDRLRKRGMPHKKALVACSNKMARIMYAILKNGVPYKNNE